MNQLKEQQKEKALEWLKALGAHEDIIKAFRENGTVTISETVPVAENSLMILPGKVEDEPLDLAGKIKEFEDEYSALVYHVQLSHTKIGDMYSLLYVSRHVEEWPEDDAIIQEGALYSYVWNATIEHNSEIGLVELKSVNGYLYREGLEPFLYKSPQEWLGVTYIEAE